MYFECFCDLYKHRASIRNAAIYFGHFTKYCLQPSSLTWILGWETSVGGEQWSCHWLKIDGNRYKPRMVVVPEMLFALLSSATSKNISISHRAQQFCQRCSETHTSATSTLFLTWTRKSQTFQLLIPRVDWLPHYPKSWLHAITLKGLALNFINSGIFFSFSF